MENGREYSVQEQCELLLKVDHHLHEEIIGNLQILKDPYAVPFIRQAVLLKPRLEYLAYDDYGGYYKKCFWALRAIGTPEALAVIDEFSQSTDRAIREQATYRIAQNSGHAL